jgi:hypothetical protein
MDIDVAADMDVDMAIDMDVDINIDMADDVDANSPYFHGPVSSDPNIFGLLIICDGATNIRPVQGSSSSIGP